MAMERTATAVEGLADRINRISHDVAGAAPLRNEGGLHEDWRRVLLSGDRS